MRGEIYGLLILLVSFLLIFISFSGCLGNGDTDGDGLSDGIETAGWNVFVYDINGVEKQIHVTSDPNKADTDGDGLSDYEEFKDYGKLNPRKADTDGDGLSDYQEVKVYHTEPNKQDSEIWPDGLSDGMEVRGWNITVNGETKRVHSDPTLYDTDGDGLSDYQEWKNHTDPSSKDTDSDGSSDLIDIYPCRNLKLEFILNSIHLSQDYGKTAKIYFIIRPDGSEIKRTDFLTIQNGSTISNPNFVEVVDPSDNKNLYPIEIQLSSFDNSTQETSTGYLIGEGTYTIKVDKPLNINGESSAFNFVFDPNYTERSFNISGDDLSISFTIRVKGD